MVLMHAHLFLFFNRHYSNFIRSMFLNIKILVHGVFRLLMIPNNTIPLRVMRHGQLLKNLRIMTMRMYFFLICITEISSIRYSRNF